MAHGQLPPLQLDDDVAPIIRRPEDNRLLSRFSFYGILQQTGSFTNGKESRGLEHEKMKNRRNFSAGPASDRAGRGLQQ